MRNIIVAVHGGAGAGKTTFSAALAAALASIKNISAVLLISPDVYNPAYATLFPRDKGMRLESLGRLADNPYFDQDFVKKCLTPYPRNEAIGILGYLKDDNVEKYNRIEENLAIRLLDVARSFAEITLVDCASPYEDAISHMALLKADVIFSLVEPNVKGVGNYLAEKSIYGAIDGVPAKHLFLASPTHSHAPVEDAASVIGHPFYDVLPYTEEASVKLSNGDLISKYNSRYAVPVSRCAGIVREAMGNG